METLTKTPTRIEEFTKGNLNKIKFFLDEILDKFQIAPSNVINIPGSIKHYTNPPHRVYDFETRSYLVGVLKGLSIVERCEIMKHSNANGTTKSFSLEIGKDVLEQTIDNVDYRIKQQNEGLCYKLSIVDIDETHLGVIVDDFIIGKPLKGKENATIIKFLYDNVGQSFSAADIKNQTGLKNLKQLRRIIEECGFAGDLKTLFWGVLSEDSVCLKFKEAYKDDLIDAGIESGFVRVNLKSSEDK